MLQELCAAGLSCCFSSQQQVRSGTWYSQSRPPPAHASCFQGSHHLIPATMGKWRLREVVTCQSHTAGEQSWNPRPLRPSSADSGPCQECSGCLGVALSCQSVFRVFRALVGRAASGGCADRVLLGTCVCKILRRFKGTKYKLLIQLPSRGYDQASMSYLHHYCGPFLRLGTYGQGWDAGGHQACPWLSRALVDRTQRAPSQTHYPGPHMAGAEKGSMVNPNIDSVGRATSLLCSPQRGQTVASLWTAGPAR